MKLTGGYRGEVFTFKTPMDSNISNRGNRYWFTSIVFLCVFRRLCDIHGKKCGRLIKENMVKLIALFAGKFLSDETLIALLVKRGYSKVSVQDGDGIKYQTWEIKPVKDKFVTQVFPVDPEVPVTTLGKKVKVK